MAIVKNKATQEDQEFWSHVETVAKEDRDWPDWIAHRQENENENGTNAPVRCDVQRSEDNEQ